MQLSHLSSEEIINFCLDFKQSQMFSSTEEKVTFLKPYRRVIWFLEKGLTGGMAKILSKS